MVYLYFGVLGSVIGYAFQCAGANIISLVQRKQKIDEEIGKCLLISGVTCFAFGAFLVLSSLAFLPQILVVSLGSLQTVYSLVWHRFFNGIPVSIRQLVGASCVCAGCVLMYQDCKSRMQTPLMNPVQLFHAYSAPTYQTYLTIVCFLHFIISTYNQCQPQSKNNRNLVDTILYSVQGAMLGTQFMVMSKTIGMLLRLHVSHEVNFFNTFNGGFLCATSFVAIISILFWSNRGSIGESRFDISIIKPTNKITWIIFGVLSGGLYFEEIQSAGLVHVFYALLYIVLGIWFGHLDPLLHGVDEPKKEKLFLLTDSSDEEDFSTSDSLNIDVIDSP